MKRYMKTVGLKRNMSIFAASRDVIIMLKREEFVIRMAQRGNSAALRDVPIMQRREEFVLRMERR
jgi:hypothetical protein